MIEHLIIALGTLNKLDLSRYNRKKDKNFLYVKKLLFNIKKVQKWQQLGLKLYGAKNINIDSSSSIYSKNKSLIFELGKKHNFFDP